MRQSWRGELMKPAPAWIQNLGAWIPKLGFSGGGFEEAGV